MNHAPPELTLRHQVQLLVPYAFLGRSQLALEPLHVLFALQDPTLRHHRVLVHHFLARFALLILFPPIQVPLLVLFVSLARRATFLSQVVRRAQLLLGRNLTLLWQFLDGSLG